MSWQVRLGSLDEEIKDFLEDNPDFPIKNEREFVKFAVRKTMVDLSMEEKTFSEMEEMIDKKIEEQLS